MGTLEPESWERRNDVVNDSSNEEHDCGKNDNKDDVEQKYAFGIDCGEEVLDGSWKVLLDCVDWEDVGPCWEYDSHVVYNLEVEAVHEEALWAVDGPPGVRE